MRGMESDGTIKQSFTIPTDGTAEGTKSAKALAESIAVALNQIEAQRGGHYVWKIERTDDAIGTDGLAHTIVGLVVGKPRT